MPPEQLPDINLLPHKERQESIYYGVFLGILGLCVLLSAFMIFYFYQTKSKLETAQQQVSQLELERNALQKSVGQSDGQAEPISEIVKYAEARRLPASTLINGLIKNLPANSYLSKFNYTAGQVEITTEFETMRAASDYVASLNGMNYIIQPRISKVEAFVLKNEGTLDTGGAEALARYDVIPRHEVIFTFGIDELSLKQAKEEEAKNE